MTHWRHLCLPLLTLIACQAAPDDRCQITRGGPQRQITAVSGDCQGRDFSGQDLSGADLSGLRGDITCPDGTRSDDNGGSCRGHLSPQAPDLTDDAPDDAPDITLDLADDLADQAPDDLADDDAPDLAPDLPAPDLDTPDALTCDLACGQPEDTCDNNTAVHYRGPGALTDDCRCDLSAQEERTDCAPLGLTCWQGQCGPARQRAGFVRIEPTTFIIGSSPNDPLHQPNEANLSVTLTRPFWIKATEITQAEYATFFTLLNENRSCGPNCPAVELRWEHAAQYANALSEADGLPPCYDTATLSVLNDTQDPYRCRGYRLPTEAEWELACATTDRLTYGCVGPDCQLTDVWTRQNADATRPVAQLTPNPLGLFDISGNVSEWTHDHYLTTHPGGIDPFVPNNPDDSQRTLRGGAWILNPNDARCARRQQRLPYDRRNWIGARIVRTIHPDE